MAAGYDGSIRIATEIDSKNFNKGVQEVNAGVGNVSGSLKGLAAAVGIGFSVAAVKGFGDKIIETSAELQAMKAQFNEVFKEDSSKALEGISEQAKQLGIHSDRLTVSWNKFGGQVKGAGMDGAQALEATAKATNLAADAAAFYDVSLETASASVASFMKGNFEAGDAIGVFTNAKQMDVRSNEAYGKSWADLSEAERQWLLLDTVGKTYEMNGAIGQATREQNNWANVTANLSSTWASFLEIVGSPILSGAVKVIQSATELVSGLIGILTEHKDLIPAIGIAVGTLTTAIVAYNVAQNSAAIATTLSTAATTAFGAVMAFLTSPITLVIAAIGALIAIGYLLITHWDEIKIAALNAWKGIEETWQVASEWFNNTIVIPVQNAFTCLWNNVTYAARVAWDQVRGVWVAVSGWFKSKVIDPISNGFKSGINFMIGLVEGFVNRFIRGVNKIIEALNSISIDVPKGVPFIGGTKFGISIPTVREISIPKLATGAVIPPNSEFLAILGDQKSGKNIETPEGLLRQIIKEELGGIGQQQIPDTQINMYLDDDVIGKAVVAWIDRQVARSGELPFSLGRL